MPPKAIDKRVVDFLLQIVACWILALLYHWPLNAYLMRQSKKGFLFSITWSFVFSVVAWFSYQWFQGSAWSSDSLVVLLLWLVPQALHALYAWLIWQQNASVSDPGKELGFVLFSPLCTVCVVISVPLVVALLRHLTT
jgi:hypothetical protein